MRLSREQFFDLVELVGKAVATARQRPVDEAWLDEISPGWLRKRPKPKPREDDDFGLFSGTPWQDSESDSERTDLETVAPGADYKFGFSDLEKRKARRNQNEYGDTVSCQLWEIQRQVRFREISVTDGLEELRQLCQGLVGYISPGWARSVRAVIDRCCL